MITLYIAIVPIVLGSVIGGWLGFILMMIIAAVLVMSPLEGYYARQLESEIPLLKLKRPVNSSGACIYAEKYKRKAIIAYDNRDTYDIGFEAYEEMTLWRNIKIYESDECKQPILRVFVSDPKREMWTFCFIKRVENVLLLPKDTTFYRKNNKELNMDIVV